MKEKPKNDEKKEEIKEEVQKDKLEIPGANKKSYDEKQNSKEGVDENDDSSFVIE